MAFCSQTNPSNSIVQRQNDSKVEVQKQYTIFKKIRAVSLLLKSRIRHGLLFTSTTISGLVVVTNLHPHPSLLLLSSFVSLLSTLSVYLMNDFVDVDIDRINAPSRPLVSGSVKKSEAFLIILMLTAGSVGFAFLMSPLAVVLVSSYLMIGVVYSVPKIALQNRFLVKTSLVASGALLTTLIGSTASGVFEPHSFIIALTFMSFMFVTSPINDLADYVGDKKHGKRTIPVVIGQKRTVLFTITLPFIIATFFWIYYQSWNFGILTPISLTVLSFVAFKILCPIYNKSSDYKYIRKRHKKTLLLHYGLQLGLIIGIIGVL